MGTAKKAQNLNRNHRLLLHRFAVWILTPSTKILEPLATTPQDQTQDPERKARKPAKCKACIKHFTQRFPQTLGFSVHKPERLRTLIRHSTPVQRLDNSVPNLLGVVSGYNIVIVALHIANPLPQTQQPKPKSKSRTPNI